ncbi:MAG: hypothetical protein KAQ68_02245 [Clostridiales bacterium]|nr:hypothetical protein [Clostridiales bacterium]
MIRFEKKPRIRQGDILKNIQYLESMNIEDEHIIVDTINFPYSLVLSQDCDLTQDYKRCLNNKEVEEKSEGKPKHGQYVLSIILVPLYNADHFFEGEHLSELNYNIEPIQRMKKKKPTSIAKNIYDNNNPRYHYLEFSKDDRIDLPDCVIDFKHFFTVNRNYLIEQKSSHYICSLDYLYREGVSHRFAYYLSRIGIPAADDELIEQN